MQAEDTTKVICYLNARRGGNTDRQILARLRADRGHGKTASSIVRRALAEHYGIERPTLAHQDNAQIDALTAQVSTLAQSVIDLQQQVSALTGQVAMMQQQAAVTAALLAALVGNDKGTKQQARELAGHALAALGNGNGNGGR